MDDGSGPRPIREWFTVRALERWLKDDMCEKEETMKHANDEREQGTCMGIRDLWRHCALAGGLSRVGVRVAVQDAKGIGRGRTGNGRTVSGHVVALQPGESGL